MKSTDIADIRSAWIQKGWKRGVFIDVHKNACIISELPDVVQKICECNNGKNIYLIPILYDCALVDSCFIKEPWVQVILGVECSGDGNFKYAKNPRKLHLPVDISGESSYLEFSSVGILQLDRETLLSNTEPCQNITWINSSKEILLDWIADRYRQATFPDSFNRRVYSVANLLKRTYKKEDFVEYCAGIYIKLNDDEELPDSALYSVTIIILIPDDAPLRKIRQEKIDQSMIQLLAQNFNTAKGITVSSIDILPEGEFTKKIERQFKKLSLEHHSYASNDDMLINPIPADYLGSKK